MPATDRYEALRASIFEVIWRDLDPQARMIEEARTPSLQAVMPILRDCGALRLLVPAEYGGSGLTVEQYLPVIAEFAKIHGAVRLIVHVHNSFAYTLSRIGDDAQRERILPRVAAGEGPIAFALTEPDHGTGADLGTTARRSGGDYIVDGRKWLISASEIASCFLVFARTAATEVSALIVERDRPGLRIEPHPDTMGCKGGQYGKLTFDGVRVPSANLVGCEGQGLDHLEYALETSRLMVAAASLGTAQHALDLSVAHAGDRTTFGRPLSQRQAVQRYLAEMAVDVYALRHMLLDAARKWDTGRRIPLEASLCKLFGLEAVGRVTDRALLVHGGIGYTGQSPIERLYRDARLNWIEEGPPTVQYLVAARELSGGHRWDDAFAGDLLGEARRPSKSGR